MVSIISFNEFEKNLKLATDPKTRQVIFTVSIDRVHCRKYINESLITEENKHFHLIEMYKTYVFKETGLLEINTGHWDIFIDEQKIDGKISNLGFLFYKGIFQVNIIKYCLKLKTMF
ncbi:hypothetical protein AB3N59_15040 [Leptospira sp. WS92.C1]